MIDTEGILRNNMEIESLKQLIEKRMKENGWGENRMEMCRLAIEAEERLGPDRVTQIKKAIKEIEEYKMTEFNMNRRFMDNGDGTVTDTSTGLTWQQQTAGPMTWEGAQEYCSKLDLAGNGWRLPNRIELESILDLTRYDPAIDINIFPGTMSAHYWSSTTYAYDTDNAWCVYFGYGHISNLGKSKRYYVRGVQAG